MPPQPTPNDALHAALAQVAPGTKARIRIPALDGAPIEATLTRYGITADREAGTIESRSSAAR